MANILNNLFKGKKASIKLDSLDAKDLNSAIESFQQDHFANPDTGLGILGIDKSMSGSPVYSQFSKSQAETFYASIDIAAKIIDRVAQDMWREGFDINNLDTDKKEKFELYKKRILLNSRGLETTRSSRIYGGSGLLIITDDISTDEGFEEPLNLNRFSTIKSLIEFNMHQLIADSNTIDYDFESHNYGLPEFYKLTTSDGTMYNIHHTRIARFDGALLPQDLFVNNGYWHESVLKRLYRVISNYCQANDSMTTLISDFRLSILKLKNLVEMIARGDSKKVLERFKLLNLTKSVFKTIVLNESEEYEDKTSNVSGLKDLITEVNNRLVAASGLPHTIVLGESPSGLGASGESEKSDYYDYISQEQERVLKKPLEYILRLMMLSKEIGMTDEEIKNYSISFNSLYQLDDEDRAKMEKTVSEKDQVYIDMGVLTSDEVRNSRYGGDEYSQDTTLDANASPELERNELELKEAKPNEKEKR